MYFFLFHLYYTGFIHASKRFEWDSWKRVITHLFDRISEARTWWYHGMQDIFYIHLVQRMQKDTHLLSIGPMIIFFFTLGMFYKYLISCVCFLCDCKHCIDSLVYLQPFHCIKTVGIGGISWFFLLLSHIDDFLWKYFLDVDLIIAFPNMQIGTITCVHELFSLFLLSKRYFFLISLLLVHNQSWGCRHSIKWLTCMNLPKQMPPILKL